eukprot:TRINITY_DN92341_c0_g1_i1.p1 TRINITY_DN92341_c0_g1~~TRINITY_DN92341_c0_g1_i1.p1  ORF type:complete len:781 (+),score=150.00 TRINITY_DN92341_c0_g1_i1:113-2455(+)
MHVPDRGAVDGDATDDGSNSCYSDDDRLPPESCVLVGGKLKAASKVARRAKSSACGPDALEAAARELGLVPTRQDEGLGSDRQACCKESTVDDSLILHLQFPEPSSAKASGACAEEVSLSTDVVSLEPEPLPTDVVATEPLPTDVVVIPEPASLTTDIIGVPEEQHAASGGAHLVHVTLECIHVRGQPGLPDASPFARRLILPAGRGPWLIGRQAQPQFFTRLVPDEELRSCISRNHFELCWKGSDLTLRQLSANTLWLDGMMTTSDDVIIEHGSKVGLCLPGDAGSPFLVFCVLLSDTQPPKVSEAEDSPGSPTFGSLSSPPPEPSEASLPDKQQEAHLPLPKEEMQSDQMEEAAQQVSPAEQTSQLSQPQESQHVAQLLLLCTKLRGCSVDRLPSELRQVDLILQSGKLVIGRQHQTGFFEGLLGKDHPLTSYISRSHFELCSVGKGSWEVTNLSNNTITIGQKELARGERAVKELPLEIGFLASFTQPDEQVLPPEVFLAVMLTAKGDVQNSPESSEGYALEIGGSALNPGFPEARRRLCLTESLVVGRLCQVELHQEALPEQALQWVSREHFRVDVAPRAGETHFSLTPLSSNPMWRERGNMRTLMKKGCGAVALLPQDRILLFTGAHDGTPSGSGSQGSLYWTFLASKEEDRAVKPSLTPPVQQSVAVKQAMTPAVVSMAGSLPVQRQARVTSVHAASSQAASAAASHVAVGKGYVQNYVPVAMPAASPGVIGVPGVAMSCVAAPKPVPPSVVQKVVLTPRSAQRSFPPQSRPNG